MCGVTGLINLNGEAVSPVILKNMADAIAHRGPDGEGQWIEGGVGLGHRRLSIIDLSDVANQPMLSLDRRYVMSYNGELYNYKELTSELRALGCKFFSKSDSEVILNAYAVWGTAALDKFNGMFAFAIWDRQTKTLCLARDRYGIKPLYYALSNGTFLFGSEQKAILQNPAIRSVIDKEALVEYFTFQNIITDKTFIKGLHILLPGHVMIVDPSKKHPIKFTQYWDFCFQEPSIRLSDDEYREELDRLFHQAVQRQLVADVELGAYLSGGIDSGAITAIASRSYPYMKTFTCGFDLHSASGMELAYDERERAEMMSYHCKTEHYEMVLKAGDMERALPDLAFHLEEPRVGQSYPNYYAAKLASKFVKVVLSGAGGDELFGGYPWRYYRAVVNSNFEDYVDKYYLFWQRLVPNSTLREMFSPIWHEVDHVWTRDIFQNVFQHHASKLTRPEDYINHSLYFEAKTFLHGLLVVEDKLSMAHGLETRVPFLDNDLVDFAMQCPVHLKLNNLAQAARLNENVAGDKRGTYFLKTKDGKQIVRDVIGKYIPSEVSNAIKQGFSAPDSSWFKGDSIDFVRRELMSKDIPLYNYVDRNIVYNLIDEHLNGKKNRRLLIWSFLNVNTWLERANIA